MRFCFIWMFASLFFLLSSDAVAQQLSDSRIVFEEIEQGIENGNVSQFSQRLAPQVQVNLKGEETGYYSSSQAYYILERYFKTRKTLSFEFSSVSDTESTPYATGSATFRSKTGRSITQVYVSLMRSGDRWMIAVINIY